MGAAETRALGERKVVSILFADLVGSTSLGDGEDPERTRALLERFYVAMTEVLEAAEGTIEKFAGDAVLTVFGAPVAQEDHAERALHASLAMRARLAADFPGLELRIGVNTGEVLVGAPRAGSAFVSGDSVNVAARLEQNADAGQILAGARTVAAVGAAFEFAPPFEVAAKGKRGGVLAFELVEAVARTRPRGLTSLGSTFVGRTAELEQIRAAWRRLSEKRESSLLVLIGDAGIGKTSLVERALGWLGAQAPKPVVRSGRCLAYGQGLTYWPLAEVLREQFGIARLASNDEILDRLGGNEILGMTFGLEVGGELHPLAARERFHDAWVTLLETMTADVPAAIVIEDLHWAEEPLLDLLEELAREVRAPVLLIATARPEFAELRPAPTARTRSTAIWLEPLSPVDAGAMVARLLGGSAPPGFEELVVERADGNPFFVEELLASLIDRGVLSDAAGDWALAEGGGAEIPDSVRAVIAARMDLLGDTEKGALQAASVAGRTFFSAAVVELLDGPVPDFSALEDRDFVRRVSRPSSGEREYTFKHALTRDVAYASVPRARRAQLHARFAERLERVGETGDQFASLLAHHYFEAVRPENADLAWGAEPERLAELTERAVAWLGRAGELALGRFAIDDGLAILDRALGLEPPRETQARIWRAIGRAHALRYSGHLAVEAYEKAARLSDDPELEGEICGELALECVIRYGMFNPMPTRELVDGWIDRATALAVPGSPARVKALVARAIWSPGLDEVAAEAVEIAEELGEPDLRSHAYNGSACSAFAEHRYDESREWAERRLALLDRISDPDHIVDIWSAVIPGLLGCGRFDDARRYADRHDEAASRLSTHHQVHGVAMKLELEELAGRWDLMRELEPRTREVVEANVDTPCIRNSRSLLACAVAGSIGGDESRSRELEARAAEFEQAGFGTTMASLRIRLALSRGELGEVEALVRGEAILPPPVKNWWLLNTVSARLDGLAALGERSAVEAEAPAYDVDGTYLQPFALRALGLVCGDEAVLAEALARFQALGLEWHADETRARLSSG